MRRFLGNIFSCCFSLIKFSILKLFCWKSFFFYWIERFSPNVSVKVGKKSTLMFGKRVRVHSNSKIISTAGGCLRIEDDCKFNYGCMVVSRQMIHIKKGVEFGPNVIIYDHDHDFRAKGGLKAGAFKCAPVVIGENCWIGANTIILKGTTIGDNCVVGAGCVVSGNIPPNTVLVQKRENTLIPIDLEEIANAVE